MLFCNYPAPGPSWPLAHSTQPAHLTLHIQPPHPPSHPQTCPTTSRGLSKWPAPSWPSALRPRMPLASPCSFLSLLPASPAATPASAASAAFTLLSLAAAAATTATTHRWATEAIAHNTAHGRLPLSWMPTTRCLTLFPAAPVSRPPHCPP